MAGTAEKLCHPGGWACWGISGPRAGWDPGSLGASLEALDHRRELVTVALPLA